jgi:exopolyphosphatase/guanosine-5'-triphosphate,3'-diphosphate pyrophosphatase
MEDYLVIAKLTAILRAANALDRTHQQKITDASVAVKGSELVISTTGNEDLTLEKGTLEEENSLFEEVFNLRPVLHQKRKQL